MDKYITLVRNEDGSVGFLKVSKIGRRWVYGTALYYSDGELKTAYFETKYDLEKHQIFEGLRTDLQQRYLEYRQAVSEWEEKRKQTFAEIDRQASHWAWEQRDKWYKDNPSPQPPKIQNTLLQE